MKDNFNTILNSSIPLIKSKEDEVTWLKINTCFEKLIGLMQAENEASLLLQSLKELLMRSILSERSKLSGTALNLLKRCLELLKRNESGLEIFLDPLIKLCGRTSRVFSVRGEEALLELSKYLNLHKQMSMLKEYSNSASKNVRLCVYKSIYTYLTFNENRNTKNDFISLINKGKEDSHFETREICKRILGFIDGNSKENEIINLKEGVENERTAKRNVFTEVDKVVPMQQRAPFRTAFKPKIEYEERSRKNFREHYSPFKKHVKVSENEIKTKIEEFKSENYIKNIFKRKDLMDNDLKEKNEEGKNSDEVNKNAGAYSKQAINQKINNLLNLKTSFNIEDAKNKDFTKRNHLKPASLKNDKKSINCDELTPCRLNKYLLKYKEEAKNINEDLGMPKKVFNLKNEVLTVDSFSKSPVKDAINFNKESIISSIKELSKKMSIEKSINIENNETEFNKEEEKLSFVEDSSKEDNKNVIPKEEDKILFTNDSTKEEEGSCKEELIDEEAKDSFMKDSNNEERINSVERISLDTTEDVVKNNLGSELKNEKLIVKENYDLIEIQNDISNISFKEEAFSQMDSLSENKSILCNDQKDEDVEAKDINNTKTFSDTLLNNDVESNLINDSIIYTIPNVSFQSDIPNVLLSAENSLADLREEFKEDSVIESINNSKAEISLQKDKEFNVDLELSRLSINEETNAKNESVAENNSKINDFDRDIMNVSQNNSFLVDDSQYSDVFQEEYSINLQDKKEEELFKRILPKISINSNDFSEFDSVIQVNKKTVIKKRDDE